MSKANASHILDPGFLGELESERTYSSALYTRTRRVKLEKGESCLIRVLPVAMGRSKSWVARIAQHWMNKKATTCPRFTHPDFGGDPSAHCEACEVTDEAYNQAATDEETQFARDASVKVKWQTWCLVFERDNGRTQEVIQPPEVWHPYEFSMSKPTHDDLAAMIQRSARVKGNPLGILDLEFGHDLWLTRSANNYKIDKSDGGPSPIAEVDDKFQALVEKILSECKQPSVRVATADQLEDFALKFSSALADQSGRGRRGASRSRSDDDSPRSRRDAGEEAPRRSFRGGQGGDEPEAPARRRAVTEAEPAERPQRRAAAASEPEPAPRASRGQPSPPTDGDDSNPELMPVVSRRQAAEPDPEPAERPRRSAAASEPEPEPAPRVSRAGLSRLPAEEAPPSRVSTAPPRRVAEGQEDPDDTAPEEARDPVPPANGEPPDGEPEAGRPAVNPLSSALRRNIGVLNQRRGA